MSGAIIDGKRDEEIRSAFNYKVEDHNKNYQRTRIMAESFQIDMEDSYAVGTTSKPTWDWPYGRLTACLG